MEGRMPKPRVTTRGKEGGKEKGRFHKRDVYLSSLSRSLSLSTLILIILIIIIIIIALIF
jgi:subtilase family serine protease